MTPSPATAARKWGACASRPGRCQGRPRAITSAMNKIERVRAALAGRPVDRAPFTVWYHFGNQHAPAERTAQVHLEFFEHYDLDLLKLMNDYDYPMPAGLEVVATADDLARLQPFDPTKTPFGTQLQTVELAARALRDLSPFVATAFNASNTLKSDLVRAAVRPGAALGPRPSAEAPPRRPGQASPAAVGAGGAPPSTAPPGRRQPPTASRPLARAAREESAKSP